MSDRDFSAQFSDFVSRKQEEICTALAELDGSSFREDQWKRLEGGGGRTRIMEDSQLFDRAGVNISEVYGQLPETAFEAMRDRRLELKSFSNSPQFHAAGISLVLHPKNPNAPTVHANYRYFECGDEVDQRVWWFGGGADLTPSYLYEEDAAHFHATHKAACDAFDKNYYPRFKQWCDRYFRIQHRNESRGIGGIFFDDLTGDRERLFQFVQSCADAFLEAYLPILKRRHHSPFTEAQRSWQQLRRGRYVEFNLVYDRGTAFGLRTGGRIESILMSLPRIARWAYDAEPAQGTEEARLVDVLRNPREWV